MEFSLFAAFVIGLFSTVHCLGMCGGISGALTAGVDPSQRAHAGRLVLFSTTYSLGRITTYTIAGAVTGALGGSIVTHMGPQGAWIAQLVAASFLAALGLYIAGWLPGLAKLERIGLPLWRRLEPVGRRLLPVRRLPHAYAFGLVWGWLPCGLTYSALIYTLGAGGALQGAGFMLFFGLGTLPAMAAAGAAAGAVLNWIRRPPVRRAFGVVIIITAIAMPLAHRLDLLGHGDGHSHGAAEHAHQPADSGHDHHDHDHMHDHDHDHRH